MLVKEEEFWLLVLYRSRKMYFSRIYFFGAVALRKFVIEVGLQNKLRQVHIC
jgi:hypothetical protein